MKTELLYDRYDTEKMTTDELKTIIWRYFTSYWNNRRICSTNRGLPPNDQKTTILRFPEGSSIGFKSLEENVSTNIDNISFSLFTGGFLALLGVDCLEHLGHQLHL